MKKVVLLLAGLLLFLFNSCGTIDEGIDEFANLGDDDQEKAAEKIENEAPISEDDLVASTVASAALDESSSSGTSVSYGDEDNVDRVKQLILEGRYSDALRAAGEPQSERMKYYVGIINYARMLMRGKYSDSQRATFRDNAIRLLKQVGYEATEDSLKARSLLWYGMAVHLNYETLRKKREAIGAFHYITSTRLKDTSVYDDAIYYTGKVYTQMGWYIQARKFYKKLKTIRSSDNQIYDPYYGEYVSTRRASTMGLDEVRKICMSSSAEAYEDSSYDSEPAVEEVAVEDTTVTEVPEEAPLEVAPVEAAPAEEVPLETPEETATEDTSLTSSDSSLNETATDETATESLDTETSSEEGENLDSGVSSETASSEDMLE